ncbi:MAG: phosphoglucosamine mutase [Oligoflexia bacterium]|nr:phosphoglucosamine mutase [Oligoflexia bacterium]
MKRKIFGTDGVRGIPGQEPLTVENIMELGRAVSCVLKSDDPETRGKVLIGRDTRSSGYMLEAALSAGISSMGIDVYRVGALPTPAIAFLAKDMRCDAGIIISASHNPFRDNGIKIFSRDGFKLPDDTEHHIENLMFSKELHASCAASEHLGLVKRIKDAKSRYIVFAKRTYPLDLTLDGIKVVLDCANGAAYEVAPVIFEELGAEVIKVGVDPNGSNINDNCGALHPQNIAELVRENNADIGISLDGDADRVILLDEKGEIVDGDFIMAMIAVHLKNQSRLLKNTVVVTPMTNFGMGLSMKEHDITLVQAPVGDRYVVELMRAHGYNFGGEQSGHIIFLDHTTTGDGVIAALQVLSFMVRSSKRLSSLSKVMKHFPQVLKNIKVKEKIPFEKITGFIKAQKEFEAELGDRGRIFVRYSGTENLARVMIEGENEAKINKYADELAGLIRDRIGA